jgi:hypothetical protein
MSVGLVFLACLLFSVVLVLIGWVIPASWSLASLPHVSLLPVFPVRLLDLSPVLLLPCLSVCFVLAFDALGVPMGVYVLSFFCIWWWLSMTPFKLQKGLCKLSWL